MSISAFQQDLATGQGWEAYVVQWLNDHGIEAWQPKQIPASPQEAENIAWMKRHRRSQAAIARATEYAYKNARKSEGLSRYQVDVLIRVNRRLYRCEVKAIDGALFNREEILIQSCKRLAGKQYPIDLHFIVNKDKGEIFWSDNLAASATSISNRGSETSYSIPVALLSPVFDWLQYGWQVKQSPKDRLFWQRLIYNLDEPPQALLVQP